MWASYITVLIMQVKRIHEYKRQLLNILGIIYRYDSIKNMTPEERKEVSPLPPPPNYTITLHSEHFFWPLLVCACCADALQHLFADDSCVSGSSFGRLPRLFGSL